MARVCLPQPGVCELYLPNKRRYCRFSVVAGYRYCTHHLAARSDGTADRIPCPLDPAHSIFARDLRRHLKVCPKAKEAAAEASLPCFRRDVNAGEQLTAPGAPLPATAPAPTPIAGLPLHASLAVASRAEPPLGRVSAERVRALLATVRLALGEEAGGGEGGRRVRGKEKHGLQHEAMLEVETDPVVGAYVAREFLREAGVDEDSFRLLTAISSWATSTADPAVLRLGEALGEVIDGATRAEWGRRCKRLLDLGRSRYLAARGYAVRLQTYVPQTTVCVELNISLAQNMTTVIA
ncbi:hypothetical protein EMIHUDRAFT_247952 [Emiliania huxleyi CCMP1516]|uniref:tRNA:m(4)X modification enzyme TRM13 n=2 Tax=Emiliania huxleyi TaxID=2903 RepID=A0A0D3IJK8_EMIH1|nr:hypothetical protein EMIHUDRAFT_247952 [Emiliania huxleyi CCMP1516]EOD11443.1 hypothetical protein EMIHUDRAFT_247952 [Emiliania huxleyi CCMP1516]|eukprot:XP_005763872.1 hypothetical protein EMIHUDRAFT_247952 [Emiliania huxleyi CCMP1516]